MYLCEVEGKGGISAKIVAASTANGVDLWTVETKAPKFIDAECLTGDTLLHFERQAIPGQQCLATMSIEEFHDKWVNGITKVSKLGKTFKNKFKSILGKMRLRCYAFEEERYTTTNIVDIWEAGVKCVYEVTCGDFTIKASENHYFLTQRGWVQTKDLVISDSLVRISHAGRKEVPKNYLTFNRAIKDELLEIQNYKCLDCDADINRSCDVHHIVPVTQDPTKWSHKSNVVALCRDCHIKRHVDLGRTSLSPTLAGITSIEFAGEELTYDLQVEHKDSNFVANGFVVHNCEKHRMLSSNSSSSRAIPFKPLSEVYLPFDLRKNQKGMQGYDSLDEEITEDVLDLLAGQYEATYETISWYKDKVHKQHLNRYLEPWMFQKKIITGTEWENFFRLRLAPNAQPEIRELASCIKEAMSLVEPVELEYGDWHLPYISTEVEDFDANTAIQCSVARCARVSYMTHDNQLPNLEKDLQLSKMLLNDRHMSPFEHQATPMKYPSISPLLDHVRSWEEGTTHWDLNYNKWSGNMRSWIQYRQLVYEWNG